jgi:transcriptional adapter 2-alpha
VSCSYCQRDVTTQCRIHCTICSNNNHGRKNVELCADCFASGVSFDDHKPDHDYQVVDCIDFPIFTHDWTAQEELLLLEGAFICVCLFVFMRSYR